MKLLLTDSATLKSENDISLEPLKDFGEVAEYPAISKEDFFREISDTDIILCNKTVINREIFECAKKLKYIGLFATGYNNIDVKLADEYGVTVCNAGSYSTFAVAQQVFAYILNHYSKVEEYGRLVKEGNWQKSKNFSLLTLPTDELSGKTIGIIGYGSIGKKVAEIAKAFEMRVLVYTRTKRADTSVSFVSLDELLSESDIVTVHCPLNEESAKMFNADAFSKMKKGAFFINTARGGVVDEDALLAALKTGKLSAAAIDVLNDEPMREDCVLKDAPNLLITPHTAWAPLATRQRLLSIVYENISAFLKGNPQNVVNNPKK